MSEYRNEELQRTEADMPDGEMLKSLTFFSDGLLFAMDVAFVMEIITNYDITSIPKVPDYVKGVLNLRGQIIPILDIRQRMGKPAGETVAQCIIVIEVKEVSMGILVDTVSQVLDIPVTSIRPTPDTYTQPLVSGLVHLNEEVIHIIDCESLAE